jgi:hypothetical protein
MQIASEIDSSKLDIRTQSFAHTFVVDFGLIQLLRLFLDGSNLFSGWAQVMQSLFGQM